MPKTKTNRAMAKRIKRTATGKYLREKAFRSHILTSKTQTEVPLQKGVARSAV
ncbi:MAG: 50S ribosomal protein L35 [Thaumarchaeota archaeon]|nr:50S ribosomal protein L35 [Nitrososphaerota archaeon]